MRTPGSETIVVKPELIRLVRRGDSKKWQVHYKLDGIKTWFRRSSDTADVKAASAIAEQQVRQLVLSIYPENMANGGELLNDAQVKDWLTPGTGSTLSMLLLKACRGLQK